VVPVARIAQFAAVPGQREVLGADRAELAGGLLAAVQNVSNPLLAINIGISAPLILKALAAVTPIQPPQAAPTAGKPAEPRTIDMIAGR